MPESFYPHRNYFLICAMLCVLGNYVYAGKIVENIHILKSAYEGSESGDRELILNRGDPGWVRKMARRRAARIKAKGDKTALAALETDYFKLPVLLGSYSDMPGSLTVQDFQNHLFSSTSGSTMTDYFNEVSYGQFSITGEVYGWYQTDKPVADYLPSNYAAFCLDIIQKADPDIDFSPYDNDGPDGVPNSGDDDGYVDAVMIVFAGVGAEFGNHNNLNSVQPELKPGYITDDPAYNGGFLTIRCLTLVSELRENQDSLQINYLDIANHEFGHVLGLPDLYDYSGSTMGLGRWCLMSGGINSHLSAWCKVMLGWVSPALIEDNYRIQLNPVEKNPDIYMQWEDGYGLGRYFLLEHRQRNLGFDTGIPGSGLMIYHVNENMWRGLADSKRASQSLNNCLIDLEEADGLNDLENKRTRGDNGDPFPGSSGNKTFDDFSNPSSRDFEGNPTGISITNIQYSWNLPVASFADVSPREILGYAIAYDRMGIAGGWNNEAYWGGVLFKAEKSGYLAAVDIGCPAGYYGYKVRIYQTISDTLPEGLIHSISGQAANPGFHTVNIEDKKIWLAAGQEFFVAYNTSSGVWVDDISEYTGRSYASYEGIGYEHLLFEEMGNININIRARIRTVNPVLCDFNADGAVDSGDVISLLNHLRNNPGHPAADFNRDSRANILDAFSMLLAQRNGRCEDPVDQ